MKKKTPILSWTFELNCPCCGSKVRAIETTDEVERGFVEKHCAQWIGDLVFYRHLNPLPMNIKIIGDPKRS